jgi:hypothetical protein
VGRRRLQPDSFIPCGDPANLVLISEQHIIDATVGLVGPDRDRRR